MRFTPLEISVPYSGTAEQLGIISNEVKEISYCPKFFL
jgi:hypothetical protein